ncbi:MAG: hypothetical protein AAF960_23985 [Bacteroidota bacterium]
MHLLQTIATFTPAMRRGSPIILLLLILSPVLWNGIHVLHHLIPHTHTFCLDDAKNHSHDLADCTHIHQLVHQQPNQLNPPKSIFTDYYELKTCLSEHPTVKSLFLGLTNQISFVEPYVLEEPFSDDIFHPPPIG